MSPGPRPLGLAVGITNPRLTATRRGVEVELAARLAASTGELVCVVGADPTDRDVDRQLPRLVEEWGNPASMEVNRGLHRLRVADFARTRVCVVTVSDRESVELVFPTLQQRFGFVVVDAPSRAGVGVGIAGMLLDWLDVLLVATGLHADELAETRQYLERLDARANATRVDVRVLPIGEPDGSGLTPRQLANRLAALPAVARIPPLGGAAPRTAETRAAVAAALQPIVDWLATRAAAPRQRVARV